MAWRRIEGYPGYFATPCPQCGAEDLCAACRSEIRGGNPERAADDRYAERFEESEREYVEHLERRAA